MDVRIETLEAFNIIYSAGLGPYPQSAPKAWDQLFSGLKNLKDITPKQIIGFGMDDPFLTPAPLTRYVAGTTYDGDFKDTPDLNLHKMEIKSGKYAIHTMKGPYHNMPAKFAKLRNEWLANSNEELDCSRPWIEIYLNDPFQVPEDQYLTDLHLPLK